MKTRNVTQMDWKEAKDWAREDCLFCMANLKFAKENGFEVLVDKISQEVIGVCIIPKEVKKWNTKE